LFLNRLIFPPGFPGGGVAAGLEEGKQEMTKCRHHFQG
jgi:hypothetical protein